uniref:Uncharacterized protein n=1 Tax=uncultured prokaryote TaxID=198431 RepID=A0A0H5Q4D7_9ZZZZ|nr:hypothetical protein [uncultured prokaryote]
MKHMDVKGKVGDIRINLTPRPGKRLLVRVYVQHQTPRMSAPWQHVDSWVIGNCDQIVDLDSLYAAVQWAVGERALPGLDGLAEH